MTPRLSNIKEKISSVKEKVSTSSSDLESFRADETTDQLEARKERARQEARQEAKKEQRREEIEQAREQAKEQAATAAKNADGGILERAAAAIESVDDQIDLDGDGEVLSAELADPAAGEDPFGDGRPPAAADPFGNSSQPTTAPGGASTAALEQDLQSLEGDVAQNDREIEQLEQELQSQGGSSGGQPTQSDQQDPLEAMGFDDDEVLL